MRALATHELLIAWEHGGNRHPVDRALLLRALTAFDVDPATLADEPLGSCNAALLEARAATFGPRLRAGVECPQCFSALEFELDIVELLDTRPEPVDAVEVEGLRFRPPCNRDLARIATEPDVDAGVGRLAVLCALDEPLDADIVPLIAEIGRALERADPWSNLSVMMECEDCGHAWSEALDVPGLLWCEVECRVRSLLDQVHLLARAYGWSEDAILAMSDQRRAAYLQRVMT
jgi:hypothetical protein